MFFIRQKNSSLSWHKELKSKIYLNFLSIQNLRSPSHKKNFYSYSCIVIFLQFIRENKTSTHNLILENDIFSSLGPLWPGRKIFLIVKSVFSYTHWYNVVSNGAYQKIATCIYKSNFFFGKTFSTPAGIVYII